MPEKLKRYSTSEFNLENQAQAQELLNFLLKNKYNSAYELSVDLFYQSKVLYFRIFYDQVFIGITGISFKTPLLAETVKTVIDEDFRGQGHGRAVSQLVEEECLSRGVKKVMTTIYSDNLKMINIKLQQGYKIEGFHPDHEAPGFDEYSLGKIIS